MNTNIVRRAFTLIEMLTVIGILAIVMAIIIPAVGMARRAARNADTKVLLNELGNGVSVFSTDQRHMPGYFNARQMGSAANATRGFTSMDNLVVDLIGGVVKQTSATTITVGPGTLPADQVILDVDAMGSSSQSKTGVVAKGYLPALDGKRFVRQGVENGAIVDPNKRVTDSSTSDLYRLPTLIDPFGQPVLAWIADEVPPTGPFAAMDSTATPGAMFYRAQNAGFLDVTSLGKLAQDQRYDMMAKTGSILSVANATNIPRTLEALLGNSASPDPAAPAGTPRPLVARAPIVFHSAGADGIYVSGRDRGARPGYVYYTPNQDPFTGGSLFDDLIATAGH